MKEHEINSVDYHFTSKTRFEQDVAANKFVEYGDYEGNLYGTSLDSIQAVIDESKICLLNLHAQVKFEKESKMVMGWLILDICQILKEKHCTSVDSFSNDLVNCLKKCPPPKKRKKEKEQGSIMCK